MTKIEQIRKTVDAIRTKEMTTPDEVFGAAIDLFDEMMHLAEYVEHKLAELQRRIDQEPQ
jgi:hypothetical protein